MNLFFSDTYLIIFPSFYSLPLHIILNVLIFYHSSFGFFLSQVCIFSHFNFVYLRNSNSYLCAVNINIYDSIVILSSEQQPCVSKYLFDISIWMSHRCLIRTSVRWVDSYFLYSLSRYGLPFSFKKEQILVGSRYHHLCDWEGDPLNFKWSC